MEFIGWDPVQRAERLERVCCNQRLCVLSEAEAVPHAASRALAQMLRQLPADHLQAFGARLAAVESLTDPQARAGTTYAACGFTQAGLTAGYGRSRGAAHFVHHGRPKAYWIRELAPGGLAALAAAFDSRPLTGLTGPDFSKLDMSGDKGLLGYLAEVTGHRKPKGARHDLAAILAVVVVARLSGADSVYAAAQFAATMPQEALRRCGIRYNRRPGRYVPPSHKTIKRAVRKVGAQAADEQMCAWLRAEAAAGRLTWRHIAIDGKTLRGAREPAVTAAAARKSRRPRPAGPAGSRARLGRRRLSCLGARPRGPGRLGQRRDRPAGHQRLRVRPQRHVQGRLVIGHAPRLEPRRPHPDSTADHHSRRGRPLAGARSPPAYSDIPPATSPLTCALTAHCGFRRLRSARPAARETSGRDRRAGHRGAVQGSRPRSCAPSPGTDRTPELRTEEPLPSDTGRLDDRRADPEHRAEYATRLGPADRIPVAALHARSAIRSPQLDDSQNEPVPGTAQQRAHPA